jgi:hypothetical protein
VNKQGLEKQRVNLITFGSKGYHDAREICGPDKGLAGHSIKKIPSAQVDWIRLSPRVSFMRASDFGSIGKVRNPHTAGIKTDERQSGVEFFGEV